MTLAQLGRGEELGMCGCHHGVFSSPPILTRTSSPPLTSSSTSGQAHRLSAWGIFSLVSFPSATSTTSSPSLLFWSSKKLSGENQTTIANSGLWIFVLLMFVSRPWVGNHLEWLMLVLFICTFRGIEGGEGIRGFNLPGMGG